MQYEIEIKGKVPSKSNQYRIFPRGKVTLAIVKAAWFKGGLSGLLGLFFLGKTKELKQYEEAFAWQCRKPNEMFTGDFEVEMNVYYPSRRADVQNAPKVILDCLQANEVIKDDRHCQVCIARRHIDKKDPRVIIKITSYN